MLIESALLIWDIREMKYIILRSKYFPGIQAVPDDHAGSSVEIHNAKVWRIGFFIRRQGCGSHSDGTAKLQ